MPKVTNAAEQAIPHRDSQDARRRPRKQRASTSCEMVLIVWPQNSMVSKQTVTRAFYP